MVNERKIFIILRLDSVAVYQSDGRLENFTLYDWYGQIINSNLWP